MFTLRDQVFPGEAGSARAVSVSGYQQEVGRVCDQVNDNDRRRAHEDTIVRTRLQRAKTTIAQRNALLDPVRRTVARSGHTLASFGALDTPTALAASRRDTEAAWNRNLARLRDYALRLDRVTTRAQLLAAVDHLSSLRPLLTSDAVTLASGLERLGAANCDLQPPRVTATFTLPPLPAEKTPHRDHHIRTSGARGTGSSGGGGGGSRGSVDTPAAPSYSQRSSSGSPGSVNTPAAPSYPRRRFRERPRSVNTPGAYSNGGGEG
jgi:hypothetical protein